MDEIDKFEEWLRLTSPYWTWDWPHQREIYKRLEMITDGTTKRLLISMPPRHGKSETVTVRYSAYRLTLDPTLNIILGCYNQKLANRFSRRIQRVVKERRIELAENCRAAEEWETKNGGGVRAVGVGAGVTGFGAGLILIDDPVKSRAEAESITRRENCWHWFTDDIYTRLEPGASIIIIQTRWHEDDLTGRLIKNSEHGGETWQNLSLQAIAEADVDDPLGREPGEALCPDRYDVDALERIRRQMGSYSFSALYQQRPVPAEGNLFRRSWFSRFVDAVPDGLVWARGYDLAISTRTSADFTASYRCALDDDGNLYIADGFRGRIDASEQKRYILSQLANERQTRHGIESSLHGTSFVQQFRREHRYLAKNLRAVRPEADKFTRALAWASYAEEGKLILVRGSWNDEFIDEACAFTGRGENHDDQIDAVSIAFEMLVNKPGRSAGY